MAEIAGVAVSAVACVAQCFSPVIRRINRWREFERNFQNLKIEVENLKVKSRSIQRQVDEAKKNGDTIEEDVQNWLKKVKEIQENFQKWHERASKFKRNFKILKTKLKRLKAECRSIQEVVDAAKKNGDGINENLKNWLEMMEDFEVDIQKWLERVRKLIRDDQEAGKIRKDEEPAVAEEIIADEEKTEAKSRCFKWLCPNFKSRYQLSKEAETLLEDVVKHLEVGKFDKISYHVILKDPRLSSKGYEAFESRTSTLKNVINSLSDPKVNIVGIYGMGGIGKTTLAKEVANQTKTSKLFDSVIFVEVTEKPDIMKIQKQIAEKFPGLTFSHEETESSRAGKLCQRLENEKKILLILDNIWVHLDLQAIGIPLGDGRKLLLTARSVDVLSAKMESQRNFPVQLLDDEEAWRLFKKMSSDNIEGSEFESVAREVTNKCARLPIVIVTVARALRNKELFEWEDALQQMKTFSPDNMVHIRKSIELSYNYLSPVLKKTFLLIGYANITSIDKLLMYGMVVALFEGVNKMERRRDRVLTLVQQLKDSRLLLDTNTTGQEFSMLDVIHEVAMSIASRDPQVFTKLHGELESLDKNALKVCHSIVLKDVKTGELPQVLECQQLKLLSISGVREDSLLYSLKLHDEVFIRLTELKVLVLDHVDLLSLPSSFRLLTNLRALGLYDCMLDDIAVIGDLKKLEILSLKHSYIEHLPEEVGRLTRLKLLDLRGCLRLGVIAPYVLSNLSHLEELYVGDFSGWEEEGLIKDRKNVSLDELKHLSYLTCLEIQIQDAKTLPKDLFFNKLERYKISIGPNRRLFSEDGIGTPKSCRNFSLSLINTNICSKDGHIMQLKKIEDLCLVGSQDMKSVLYGLNRDGFQHLKYLQVIDNDNLLCIVDSMKYAPNNAFPVLESLIICKLINLEKICHGRLTTESSFSQLRKIEVGGCAKLENIFSFSIARRFQLLQSIDISDCKNMKEIFAIEIEDESDSNISEVIDNIELNQLRSLCLSSLPQLKSLEYNINCSYTLFSGKVALPSLELLELDQLNVERIWRNQFAAVSSGIQNLTRLILKGCNNLRYLFSSSLIRNFVRLQHLQIRDCPSLEEIIVVDERKDVVFPQLHSLEMEGLENFSKFYSGDFIEFPSLKNLEIKRCHQLREFLVKNISMDSTEISLSFFNEEVALPSLEVLILEHCNNLKCLFSSSMTGSFDRLQYLQIWDCPYLEKIVVVNERKDVVFPQLQSLEKESLENLSKLYSGDSIQFSSLKKLEIKRCHQLREFLAKNISTVSTEISLPFFNEKVALPSLEVLVLDQINVERIWQNPIAAMSSGIQNLTELILRRCNNLKYLFSSSMIRSFDRLQYLVIYECPALEEIMVIDDEDGLRNEERKNNVAFSISSINNYLEMMVWRCDKLKTLFPCNMYRKFLRLELLSIFNCGLLEVIFDLEGSDFEDKQSAVVITQLSQLRIMGLPKLKQVWNKDPKRFVSFEKLKEVSIGDCDILKNVFPASLASSLSQLESLHISYCRVEEIVFVIKEEAEINSRFVFPRLISLTLFDLPKFTTFFSGRYTTEWSASFSMGKIFPNLEKLTVEGKSIPMIWHFSEDHFHKIKYLEVTFDDSTVISSFDFLQKFHSIKRLLIVGGTLGFLGENEMSAEISNLNKCSDLKHILKEESNMDHLIHLEVECCDNLVNLMPSSTSFRNLATLVVHNCPALTNIVTSSTAKSMGQLRKMKITGCHMITELVLADEEDEANDYKIVFGELKKLVLRDLRCLTSFCSANYTLKFPSLEEILVEKCPKMKSFTEGSLRTPKLQKVKHQRNMQVEECWKGDLNTTIEELYKGNKAQSSKEDPGQPSMQHLEKGHFSLYVGRN